MDPKKSNTLIPALLLALLMLATRLNHFGDALHLPDASWAVFFLSGFYVPQVVFFPLLLCEAGLIDYISTQWMGVSDWCISAGYALLALAYGALWFGGRWFASRATLTFKTLPQWLMVAFIGISVCFLISNASFYLLSGKFESLSWIQYAKAVAKYYPLYLQTTLSYIAVISLVHLLLKSAWLRLPHPASSASAAVSQSTIRSPAAKDINGAGK